MRVLCDLKSGFVGLEAWWQMGAYALSSLPDGSPLPPLDGALVIQCNDVDAKCLWKTKDELDHASMTFVCIKRIWDDMVASKALKNTDVYRFAKIEGTLHPCKTSEAELFGDALTYPRVTAILKGVVNRPHLNTWLVKQAVLGTLKEMIRTKRTPQETLDAYEAGFFDPNTVARAHMEKRGDEGRTLHKLFERSLRGEAIADLPEGWLKDAWNNLTRLIEKHHLTLCGTWSEQTVVNVEQGFAGTLDAIVEVVP